MVTAIILSGGVGSRIGGDTPKQYLLVQDRPIILHCLNVFEKHALVDNFIIVAVKQWQPFIRDCMEKEKIKKFAGFAEAGESRQQSVFNGLMTLKEQGAKQEDIVIVHDAVRPCVNSEIITECIKAMCWADGAMPILPMKDTIYKSADGKTINSLLKRNELFAGQAPESFRFGKYYESHMGLSEKELEEIQGSSEIAYRGGMKIHLVQGSEKNYKITTRDDLERFIRQMGEKV